MRHLSRPIPLKLSLLLLTCFLLMPLVGLSPVSEVSEAREGVVVNEILEGNILLPLRNGQIVPSKPPLSHWVSAAGAKLFNLEPEYKVRFASVVFAILSVVVLFNFTTRLFSPTRGLLASSVLLTNYGFLNLASDGRVDMVFGFFFMTAMLIWIFGLKEVVVNKSAIVIPKKYYRNSAILLGLSVMAKGPLGLVLFFLFVSLVLYIECGPKSLRQLLNLNWLWTALIALPWFLYSTLTAGNAFLQRQLYFENIARFVGGEGIVRKPWYFYLEHIWTQSAPWSFILILLAAFVMLGAKDKRLLDESSLTKSEWLAAKLSLIWILIVILFLSMSAGKRRGYLLIVLPAISIFAAVCLPLWIEKIKRACIQRAELKLMLVSCYIVLTCLILLAVIPFPLILLQSDSSLIYLPAIHPEGDRLQIALERLFREPPRILMFFYLSMVVFCLTSAVVTTIKRDNRVFNITTIGILTFILAFYLPVFSSIKSELHSKKYFANAISKIIADQDYIRVVIKQGDEDFEGLFYYLDRHVSFHNPKDNPTQSGYYLAKKQWFDRMNLQGEKSIEIKIQGGSLIDPEPQQLVLFHYSSGVS